jgi:hypothetical protein
LEAVRHFWRRLPPSYRYNWQLRRYEESFMDWNCATEAFEGIRAQDILPLLIENFHFEKFAAFGNVIDPFVDRGFGPHFDPTREWDRAFIDELHAFDERGFREGTLTPTHLFAVLSNNATAPTISVDHLTPLRALRRDPVAPLTLPEIEPPVFSEHEKNFGRILASLQSARGDLETVIASATALDSELKSRTEWALALKQQLNENTAWALTLDRQVTERTAWAQSLDKHNAELTNRILALQDELATLHDSSRQTRLARLIHRLRS